MAKKQIEVPRLKPGTYTALSVLKFVKKLVEQEPKRLEMVRWQTAFAGRLPKWIDPDFAPELPRCGTVACVGGWINIATGHRAGNIERDTDHTNPGERALKNLGLSIKERGWFPYESPAACALDRLFMQTFLSSEGVVAELTEIIDTHKKELSESKVVVK